LGPNPEHFQEKACPREGGVDAGFPSENAIAYEVVERFPNRRAL